MTFLSFSFSENLSQKISVSHSAVQSKSILIRFENRSDALNLIKCAGREESGIYTQKTISGISRMDRL